MAKPLLRIKINVLKISKPDMFVGAKGTYLDVALFENADGRDQFGNDGFIVQEVSKERREAGQKGPILGNWKYLDEPKPEPPRRRPPSPDAYQKPAERPRPPADPDLDVGSDDVPFNVEAH